MNMIAEAGTATNAQIGTWIIILFAVIQGAIGIITIFSLFATRREVDKIDERVKTLEGTDIQIRAEIGKMKDELIVSGDRRSSILHNRINPMVENLSALKGTQEAFVKSFDNFTETMKTLITAVAVGSQHTRGNTPKGL